MTGFVATDGTNELIVVSFRGSESIANYLTDVDFPLVAATDICSDCYAEDGFYTSWEEAKSGVTSAVISAAQANPNYEVISTGHSLGAAIATLCAAELRNDGYEVGLVSSTHTKHPHLFIAIQSKSGTSHIEKEQSSQYCNSLHSVPQPWAISPLQPTYPINLENPTG